MQDIAKALKVTALEKTRLSPAQECMRNIERVTNGGKMSSGQRHVYESCRRLVEGKSVVVGVAQ